MTKDEAQAIAEKRERNKGKSLSHVRWEAVHDPVKGWHPALVPIFRDDPPPLSPELLAIGRAVQLFGPSAVAAALRMMARGESPSPTSAQERVG